MPSPAQIQISGLTSFQSGNHLPYFMLLPHMFVWLEATVAVGEVATAENQTVHEKRTPSRSLLLLSLDKARFPCSLLVGNQVRLREHFSQDGCNHPQRSCTTLRLGQELISRQASHRQLPSDPPKAPATPPRSVLSESLGGTLLNPFWCVMCWLAT